MAIFKSKEFPRIAFSYEPKEQPFFKAIVKENLRKIRMLNHGRAILTAITIARPSHRSNFPNGVNVIIQPPLDRTWVAPGMNAIGTIVNQDTYDNFIKEKGVGKLMPTMSSKTAAQEVDKTSAKDGSGSVCWLFFSNNEILGSSGEWFPPHITLGHELIHCLHALNGEMKADSKDEEWATVGIKGFENNTYTENKLREEAKIPVRTKYFPND